MKKFHNIDKNNLYCHNNCFANWLGVTGFSLINFLAHTMGEINHGYKMVAIVGALFL